MRGSLHDPRTASGLGEWSVRRVRVVFCVATAAALALIVGLALLIDRESSGGPQGAEVEPRSVADDEVATDADQIAAVALPSAAPELARPGELTTDVAGSVMVPHALALGAAEVPTGFPRTVGGAIAQLAAIDEAALGSGSIPRAQEVIASWAAPGGPGPETWSGVRATAALLSAAGLASDGSSELFLEVEPAMVLVKGQIQGRAPDRAPDGPPGQSATTSDTSGGSAGDGLAVTFVVPCLQFVVTARMGSASRSTAVADCQRMVWAGDRWMVGPGAEPAPAPSVWPGSSMSYDLGFRWLEEAS